MQPTREDDTAGVHINFFNNLPVGQVISNVYLSEEISTCPKTIGTVSFEAVYFGKKCKMYFLAKTLNLYSTHSISYFEDQVFARDCYGKVT